MRVLFLLTLSLTLAACGGDGGSSPPPTNAAPVFTSAAAASIAENAAAAFYTATASDADGDPISFSISGGVDNARFAITPAGALSFASPPDFERPNDSNADNIYEVTLRASDGRSATSLNLRVTVTDVTENFRVRRVAVGLNQPLFVTGRGDGTNRIFIVEKGGQIEILNLDTGLLNTTPFLDISTTIVSDGERGLLGMALAPDFRTSGLFFVYVTNAAGDTEVRSYRVSSTNADQADLLTQNVVLSAAQPPATNHKAGWIGFGPDGFLYIATGDGGGSNDQFGNAQNLTTLLGKILRIDISRDDFASDPLRDYAIPAGNPFASGGGRPEIYAYGLRNPFRASFDRQTGALYVGDVGQNAVEEIDLIRPAEAGLNFCWPILEGTRTNQSGSTTGCTPPIAEYQHGSGPLQGNSVTGGYVYRGPVEALQGEYLFADFVSDNVWSIPVSSITQGSTLATTAFSVRTAAFAPDAGQLQSIASFGEDDPGNLFIVTISGDIFRLERQ